MRTGIVSQANGSAFIEQGNTKIVASVFGPRPIVRAGADGNAQSQLTQQMGGQGAATSSGASLGNEFSDEAIVTCDWKWSTFADAFEQHSNAGFDAESQRDMGMTVAQVLELAILRKAYPKSSIDINILVLQDDGACLSTAITCAGLALAHAGIQLYDLIPACTISLSPSKELYIDPSRTEEQAQEGQLLLAINTSSQEVSLLKQTGELSAEHTLGALGLANSGCQHVHSLLKRALLDSISSK
jgi:exosome complex component MTR3